MRDNKLPPPKALKTGVPTEEAYVLRVQNQQLADRIKGMLRNQEVAPGKLEVRFKSDKEGTFVCGEKTFPVSVRNLPCITEVWKSYDDENLVKGLDVGQIIVVRDEEAEAPAPGEYKDGLAPVMKDARTRHFRKLAELPPDLVERVETELIEIVNAGAPKGWTFEDVEEEWVEGQDGAEGHWKVISRNQY